MPEPEPNATTDRLVQMLERQHQLVAQLDDIAEGQMALIDAGDSDALLGLLGDRQKVMDELAAGQERLTALARTLRARADVGAEERQRVNRLLDDIGDRLSRIVTRDEQDRQRLRTNRDRTTEAVSGLSTARQAQHAYVRAGINRNRFADRRG
jgi:hypothetical protein